MAFPLAIEGAQQATLGQYIVTLTEKQEEFWFHTGPPTPAQVAELVPWRDLFNEPEPIEYDDAYTSNPRNIGRRVLEDILSIVGPEVTLLACWAYTPETFGSIHGLRGYPLFSFGIRNWWRDTNGEPSLTTVANIVDRELYSGQSFAYFLKLLNVLIGRDVAPPKPQLDVEDIIKNPTSDREKLLVAMLLEQRKLVEKKITA